MLQIAQDRKEGMLMKNTLIGADLTTTKLSYDV
jgi:hypothetical protein